MITLLRWLARAILLTLGAIMFVLGYVWGGILGLVVHLWAALLEGNASALRTWDALLADLEKLP